MNIYVLKVILCLIGALASVACSVLGFAVWQYERGLHKKIGGVVSICGAILAIVFLISMFLE